VIAPPQAVSPSEVRLALAETGDGLDAALLEQDHFRPRTEQAIRQQDIPRPEQVPEGAQHPQLALPLARVAADAQFQDRPTGQGEDGRDPRQREAQAGLLRHRLGVRGLVGRRVGHRHRGPVIDVHAAALPQPARLDLGVERAAGLARDLREEFLGQALAGLAVGPGLGGARALPPPQAVGD
jgi:hypothetical protein